MEFVVVANADTSQLNNNKCANCNETFASKTKLFNHINQLNHAQPVAKATKGRNKKR
jgi:DnaJ family protein A protein 5